MTASELIKHLQKKLEDDGDLPIYLASEVPRDEGYSDIATIAGLTTIIDEHEHPYYFIVCDVHTMDAFHE